MQKTVYISIICIAFFHPVLADLVAHWPADEGGGTTLQDVVGGYDGSIQGAVWSTGNVGGGLLFDGMGDTVVVPSGFSQDRFTFSGWINVQERASGSQYVFTRDQVAWSLYLNPQGTQLRFRLNTRVAGGRNEWVGANLSQRNWHHFAASFDGRTMKLYLDGEVAASAVHPVGNVNDGGLQMYIGSLDGTRNFFNGLLDDLRFYNHPLTDGEVAALAHPGNQPPRVDAGPDLSVTFPVNAIAVNATITDDGLPNPPGNPAIRWRIMEGTNAAIDDPTSEDISVTFQAPGTVVLEVQANDSEHISQDTVRLTAHPADASNTPPTVDAGPDLELTLPANSAVLDGTVSDDGLPEVPGSVSLSWSETSDASVEFSSPSSEDTNVLFPAEGVYVLVLTADDGEHTVEDSVTVTVLSDLSNQPPEAFDTLAVTVLDTAIEISLSYSDADGPGPYTYSHGVPTNGTVSGTGPLFSYRPDPGFAGRDSFWWRVDDGLNVSNQATVTIDVRSPQSTFEGILIDHNDIDAFERIPLEYVAAARDLTMVFSDRSVGMNLDQALDCFMSPSFESSPSHCRRDYTFVEPGGYWWTQNLDPEERPQALPLEQITYDPDPELYSRNNWLFEFREGTWDALTENFIEDLVPTHLAENDIVTYQFSYINNDPWLVDPECGYFATENRSGCPSHLSDWHVGRIEELEAMHPDKAFIYWTTSLNRNSEPVLTEFNDQMRDWALVNQKVLFDFADIESHNPDGSACVDGSDDEPFYYNGRFREDFEDDGVDTPAICRRYTSEITGGHLGAVSGGKIRLVKGLWLVMACIAGWDDPVCGP